MKISKRKAMRLLIDDLYQSYCPERTSIDYKEYRDKGKNFIEIVVSVEWIDSGIINNYRYYLRPFNDYGHVNAVGCHYKIGNDFDDIIEECIDKAERDSYNVFHLYCLDGTLNSITRGY